MQVWHEVWTHSQRSRHTTWRSMWPLVGTELQRFCCHFWNMTQQLTCGQLAASLLRCLDGNICSQVFGLNISYVVMWVLYILFVLQLQLQLLFFFLNLKLAMLAFLSVLMCWLGPFWALQCLLDWKLETSKTVFYRSWSMTVSWLLNTPATYKVYIMHGSPWMSTCAATVIRKSQIRLAISHGHSMLTLGQPVPALIPSQ